MVTYEVAGLEVTAPRDWSALARANAVCELQHGHDPSTLAALALLSAVAIAPEGWSSIKVARSAARMLLDGWCPGDMVVS